jgi:hypothetical protein
MTRASVRSATIPLAVALILGACSAAATSREPSQAPSSASAAASEPSPSESSLPTPAPSSFGFSDEGVIGYYESRGFVCDELQPSATAAGYFYQGCQMEDSNGRTLAIGLVTDPSGDLADGYASVQGAAGETILEPIDALDHLSGFWVRCSVRSEARRCLNGLPDTWATPTLRPRSTSWS